MSRVWAKLPEGGRPNRCGWLDDKFGLTWQIIPSALGKLLQSEDAEKSKRVMQAMLKMEKIDIHELKRTAEQQ